jgi:hypothetical protein
VGLCIRLKIKFKYSANSAFSSCSSIMTKNPSRSKHLNGKYGVYVQLSLYDMHEKHLNPVG